MSDYTIAKVNKDWKGRLEKIQKIRIGTGLDELKPGKFAGVERLTKAIITDNECIEHWKKIEDRLVKLPRKENLR